MSSQPRRLWYRGWTLLGPLLVTATMAADARAASQPPVAQPTQPPAATAPPVQPPATPPAQPAAAAGPQPAAPKRAPGQPPTEGYTPATGFPPPGGYPAETGSPPQPGYPGAPETAVPGPPASAAPVSTTPTPAPAETPADTTPYQRKVSESPFDRKGFAVGGGVGLRTCFTDRCTATGDFINSDIVRAGPGFRLAASYRFIPYVSVGLEVNLAAHGMRYRFEDTQSAFFFSWSAMPLIFVHPLAFSRWDPFVGLGVGIEQDINRTDFGESLDSVKVRTQTRRGVLRVALGLDIYVGKQLAVGPRVDIDRQFAGSFCVEQTHVRQECESIRGEIDASVRRQLPHWTTFGVDIKRHF